MEPTDKALSFLIDICEMQIEESGTALSSEKAKQILDEALNYCIKLETELDVIRRLYWKHTAQRLKDLCQKLYSITDV